jgi:hypothetical protein
MQSWRTTLVIGLLSGFLALPDIAVALPYAFVNIADTSGPFRSFGGFTQLNDLGTVAFDAFLDDGRFGIFTGPDPGLDAVIRDGDPLFGSTMNALGVIGSPFLNNAGQLTFFYGLADGRMGIARADPLVAVQAPASLALLGVNVVGLALRATRARGRRPQARTLLECPRI